MEVRLKMWVIEKLRRALQQVFFCCDADSGAPNRWKVRCTEGSAVTTRCCATAIQRSSLRLRRRSALPIFITVRGIQTPSSSSMG